MLKLEEVSFTKGAIPILENISFELLPGERLAVVGSSGSGKTTLLRLLNRLIEPSRGRIFWQGQTLKQFPVKTLRTSLVLLLQSPKLLGMRADQAIIYPLQLQNLATGEIQARLEYYRSKWTFLNQLLEKGEWELTLGERQIIAIVRALVMRPSIMLLDEPTSALDLATSDKVMKLLLEEAETESMSMIMVNSQFNLLEQFATRAIYLERGILLEQFTALTAPSWSISWQERLLNLPNDSDF